MKNIKNFRNFLLEMPKTDLHLHLDGSLRLDTLIDLAKTGNMQLPAYSQEGLKKLVFKPNYKDLGEYLEGFQYTCSVLRDKENLERVAYELAVDNQKEGVRYIEVRFAPQLNTTEKLSLKDVMISVNNGLKKAAQEFNSKLAPNEPEFHYGIIACAMRMFNEHFSPYYKNFCNVHSYSKHSEILKLAAFELAQAMVEIRDRYAIPIVAIDLAGQEDGYPAEDYTKAYEFAHTHFMHKTVHAGEAYGAESIFQAITKCYADRLGHCLYLFDKSKIQDKNISDKDQYIRNLITFIAEKRITIEVCLSSNLQTNPELTDIRNHPFKQMMKEEISLSLCTDNRLVSQTSMVKEVMLAVQSFDLSSKELKNIIIYGFKRSFYGPYDKKRKYVRQIINFYTKLEEKYNIK